MRRRQLWIAGAVVGATVMAGCASGTRPASSTADRVCFRASQVEGFDPLDDRHLLVTVRVDDEYLLTLEPCNGLAFARGIVFAEAIDRVCADGTSWIAFEETGIGAKRCRIVDIDPVADENAARALVRSRQEARDD